MRPGMKMLLLSERAGTRGGERHTGDAQGRPESPYGGTGYGNTRGGYNGPEMDYGGADDRYRSYGGRESVSAGMGNTSGFGMDDRYEMADRRYRRDERGRFASMEGYRPMNKIGFDTGGEMGYEYRSTVEYPHMDEMEHRTSPIEPGHAKGSGITKLTTEMANEWMAGIENEDGTKGPHWTLEQAKQVMAQKGMKADPLEFWTVLNSMYADYCKVFKKYGVGDKLDFYIDMAKAFIDDADAGEGKVAKYFESIVRH